MHDRARHGRIPPPRVGDRDVGRAIVVRMDASILILNSERSRPRGCLSTWGHHPLTAWCDNSGESLALWACDADVEVVHDDAGHLQDMALADPRILLRLEVELRWRQITVTTVPSSDCNECKKEPLAP